MRCHWNIARKWGYCANGYAQDYIARVLFILRDSGVILRDNAFAQLGEDHRCPECPRK
jgi:hypothetical protein